MSKSTLVTGAAGFIGSHLVESLLADGQPVVGLDNFDPFYDEETKRRNLETALASSLYQFIRGDIRDEEQVEEVMRRHGVTRIVHLAGRAGVRPSLADPLGYLDVNVRGTATLLRAAVRAGVESVVFASSSSVYGATSKLPFQEDDATDRPESPYAATKKAAEIWCA